MFPGNIEIQKFRFYHRNTLIAKNASCERTRAHVHLILLHGIKLIKNIILIFSMLFFLVKETK